MNPLVKICGNTRRQDVLRAEAYGADFLGFIIEHPPSPRSIPLETAVQMARRVALPAVAVTVNQPVERLREIHAALSEAAETVILQLHGDEPVATIEELAAAGIRVWGVASGDEDIVRARVAALTEAGAEAILLDVREITPEGTIYGGTGRIGDWNLARNLVDEGYKIILAGGLTPENVARAIETVRPWMVDVVSGVEASKGLKDRDKIREFIRQANTT